MIVSNFSITIKLILLFYKNILMVTIIKKGYSLSKIRKALRNTEKSKKLFDASKYCGVIKIKEDGLKVQKKLRDEWK